LETKTNDNPSKKTIMEGSMENLNINSGNPLAELISDDIYSLLASRGLIDEKSVRDYIIRKKFKSLRLQKISASEAIENLRSEYPYLQFDTIRKIVYQPKN
jgi:flavin-dependent dehydrogenase